MKTSVHVMISSYPRVALWRAVVYVKGLGKRGHAGKVSVSLRARPRRRHDLRASSRRKPDVWPTVSPLCPRKMRPTSSSIRKIRRLGASVRWTLRLKRRKRPGL